MSNLQSPSLPSHWLSFLSKLGTYQDDSPGAIQKEESTDCSNPKASTSILAPCPCPLHGGGSGVDNNPSLRCFLSDDDIIVIKCRTGCPTSGVLKALGLRFSDLYPPQANSESTIALDEAIRADVYECILNYLPLAPRHEKALAARGFSLDEIRRGGYKTFTKDLHDRLDAHLVEHFSREDLARVPGFTEGGILSRSELFYGLLIPIRRPAHQAPATPGLPRPYLLKTQRSTKPKYVVWSSEHLSPEPGFHWPLFNSDHPLTHLRITEGEFKADLACLRTGIPTVSMPGIDHSRGFLDFLNGFAPLVSPENLRVSWDWADVLDKPNIRRSLFLFLDYLHRHGYIPSVETWDTTPIKGTLKKIKGVDDALFADRPLSLLSYQEARTHLMALMEGALSADSTYNCPSAAASISSSDKLADNSLSVTSPFLAPLQDPPVFPLEVFPPELRPFFEQGAILTNTPHDYMATAALVVAGRAMGTKVRVSVLPGWEEQANLFAVIVAPPGSTKSPAIKEVMMPLKDLQSASWEAYLEKRKAYDQLVQMSKVSTKSKESNKLPPPPPRPYDFYVNDCTVESLVQILQQNSLSPERRDMAVLYYRDELSAWVGSLNQYRAKGEGSDREFYLSAWSGDDVKVDRKSQDAGLIFLRNPFISVLGSTTPDVVCQLESKGGKADGFFPRILCCSAPPKPAFRLPDCMPSFPARQIWSVLIKRLMLWQTATTLKPTPEAYEMLRKHYDTQANIVDSGCLDLDLKGMASKHRAYVLRFALIIHALNVALGHSATGKLSPALGVPNLRPIVSLGQLEATDVTAASRLVDYFQAHYVHVRRYMSLGPEDRRIHDFLSWAKVQGGRIEPSDLYKSTLFGCRGKNDALRLFRAAEDRGRGFTADSNGETVFFAR